MNNKKILIATGGTGGHIIPAYSLARNLSKKDFDVTLTIDQRGLNYIKNKNNLNLVIIKSSPLKSKNIFIILNSIIIIFFSIIKSLILLIFNRPSVVFGTGGYSSFPICFAASILRIKLIIYENNLVIGKANKYLSTFADKIFVSYKELEGVPKKYNDKIIEIGNIIRDEIIVSKKKVNQITYNQKISILVLGGSQAAKVFGELLPKIFEKLKNSGINLNVFHQCLRTQFDELSQFYKKAKIDHEIFNFTDKIENFYSKADLVITRSGASVLGELVNIKIPFIAIPLPTSADNHQYKNAKFYEKKGYGYLLNEKDINNKLYDLIDHIVKDTSKMKQILLKQDQYSDKEIFINIYSQIKKIIYEKN